jgi:hypothetical protein
MHFDIGPAVLNNFLVQRGYEYGFPTSFQGRRCKTQVSAQQTGANLGHLQKSYEVHRHVQK